MPKEKPARKSRPRSEEGPSIARTVRFSPTQDRLLSAEAKRQGISIPAVIEQALIARGIFPGADSAEND